MNVVGIKRGLSKETQKPFTVLHVVKSFDDYDQENSEGNAVESLYVRKNVQVEVGDEIEPVYGVGFKGMAIVKDVLVAPY